MKYDNSPRGYDYHNSIFPSDFKFDTTQYINKIIDYIKSTNGPIDENGKVGNSSSINRKSWDVNLNDPKLGSFKHYVLNSVKQSNNEMFKFELGKVLQVVYLEYSPSEDNFLDWHMDLGNKPNFNQRKLSFTLMLNDPKEYKGGNLEIWIDKDNKPSLPNNQFSLLCFPSFLLHRVTPITKGVRKVLVGFIGGEPFK